MIIGLYLWANCLCMNKHIVGLKKSFYLCSSVYYFLEGG